MTIQEQTIQQGIYTINEFWEIATAPQNLKRHLELIEGIIYEMNPPRPLHVVVGAMAVRKVGNFVEEHELGFVVGDGAGFVVAPDTVLIPDAAFISKGRLQELPEKLFPFAPDLAIEIISPSNKPREILNKIERYIRDGTQLVWAIFPDEQIVDAHTPAADGGLHLKKHTIDDILDGGSVLPGLEIPVRHLFPKLT